MPGHGRHASMEDMEISDDTKQILSRLTFTDEMALLVYDAGSGWHFTILLEDIVAIHAGDVAVGVHPYAEVTLPSRLAGEWPAVDFAAALVDDALGLADWMDWCDDVIWGATNGLGGEATAEAVRAAMHYTWRFDAQDVDIAARVDAVNASA